MSYGMEYGSFGGGFDPMGFNQFGGGGFMPAENAAPSPEKKTIEKKSIFPVTIKQFIAGEFGPDGHISIDGKEVQTVKLVGFVTSVVEHTTHAGYKLNDGTGEIDCKLWTSKEAGGNHVPIVPFSYVRIFGNPREYDGKREVIIYDITPVTDFNEVTYHILDVILSHLQMTKGPLSAPASNAAAQKPMAGGHGMQGYGQAISNNSMNMNSNNNNSNNPLVHHVIEAFKEGRYSEVGLNVTHVLQILNNRGIAATLNQVQSVTAHLIEEGTLYSTLNDSYKLTSED